MTTIEQIEVILAQIAASQAESDRRAAEAKAEADRRTAEYDRRAAEAKAEADRRAAEYDRRAAEARVTMEELKQQTRELGKQFGGLGNAFGRFTEGIALPSVGRLLFERFGVEDFMTRRRKRVGERTMELDALGVVNGSRNEAYIVEIKSHLRSDAITQMQKNLTTFHSIFTEYSQMKLYGLIVAADASPEALQEARKAGFYVVTFEDDLMHFHDDGGFMPKAFTPPTAVLQ
jgi:DNA repair exonuclease SbcCD ATPase subunit